MARKKTTSKRVRIFLDVSEDLYNDLQKLANEQGVKHTNIAKAMIRFCLQERHNLHRREVDGSFVKIWLFF